MKINTKSIGQFLKSLNEEEYHYLRLSMQLRDGISNLIKEHDLSIGQVCELFGIKPHQYSDFVSGNRNYTTMDMSNLNRAWHSLKVEAMQENLLNSVPVKFQ